MYSGVRSKTDTVKRFVGKSLLTEIQPFVRPGWYLKKALVTAVHHAGASYGGDNLNLHCDLYSRILKQFSQTLYCTITRVPPPGSWVGSVPTSENLFLVFELPHDLHLAEKRGPDGTICMIQRLF